VKFALPSRGAGRRLSGRRRAALLALLVLVLAGAGAGVFATRGSAAVKYRTVNATLGTVEQTVGLSGNLTPHNETDLDFAVASKVTAVDVTAGQTVTAGQVLATLDTTTLQGQLTQAQATLTSAQAKVTLDRQGATAQNLASANGAVASAQVNLQNDRQSAADTAAVNQQSIQSAQQAVVAAQDTVTSDQATVSNDQARVSNDQTQYNNDQCSSPSPPNPAACTTDQSSLSADQKQEATDQQTLARDQSSLSSAQGSASAATVHAQQSNDSAAAQVRSAQVQYTNAVAALNALEQGTTSSQLAIDQSSVTTAEVNVNTIQGQVDEATLTAPVAGEVAQINLAVGQAVSASGSSSSSSSASSAAASSTSTSSSSSTHQVVLLTPGAFGVTGSISDAQVAQITVGQRARVTPAGGGDTLDGHVTAVAPDATITSGVATYPVTVTIDQPDSSLRDGMSATVSIIVNEVVQVLTVPTSTVHTNATGSYVEVLNNGVEQQVTVTVGAADATRTQILSGVSNGETIVVAAISASAPTTTTGGGFGGGLLGGGGGRAGAATRGGGGG
jgi:multidrug efflux pump subunit AcrA (membrane-fusion protein)